MDSSTRRTNGYGSDMNRIALHVPALKDIGTNYIVYAETRTGSGSRFGPRKRKTKSYVDALTAGWYGFKIGQKDLVSMRGRWVITMISSILGNLFL
jgi:hypothetical protein